MADRVLRPSSWTSIAGWSTPGIVLSRLGAAIGLVVIAVVHLHLYAGEDYNHIPTIGGLFILTVISGFLLAALVLVFPSPVVGLAAAAFAAGVLGGYVLSLALPAGIFSFKEPGVSYSGGFSIAAELLVVVCGLQMARVARSRGRSVGTGTSSRSSIGS